jgi:high-affinity nickel-transport protein
MSTVRAGRLTGAERARLSAIAGVIAALHVAGWSMYLYYSRHLASAASFAGAGTLAYALGLRHAFDADHIAAIDDTTRLMLQRGRRPMGVGFFFSLGHSSVVFGLCAAIAALGSATTSGVRAFRVYGGIASTAAGMAFLLAVSAVNAVVLAGLLRAWRQLGKGQLSRAELDALLLNRGLLNRLLGGRARGLIRSSWHMFPVGVAFGLGLETASEVALLSLTAGSATGGLPLPATLTLPLLFAAGMTALDSCDGLLMARAYSWAFGSPARRLYYNATTTGMTIVVALFVVTVYLAGLAAPLLGRGGAASAYASIGNHFELLGYVIVGVFVAAWAAAALSWRLGGFERRYGKELPNDFVKSPGGRRA